MYHMFPVLYDTYHIFPILYDTYHIFPILYDAYAHACVVLYHIGNVAYPHIVVAYHT